MGIGINPKYEHDGKNYLWKNLTIPYKISDTFVGDHEKRILDMINEWNNSRMVVKYKRRDREADYVLFKETTRKNSSPAGCQKNGRPQPLHLDLDVKPNSTILHEMGHAAGLHHEHQRCDRNSYIKMSHTMFNISYKTHRTNTSNTYWTELTEQYNAKHNTDIDNVKMKDKIFTYGIIPESHIKYKIYTCYDYRSIMQYTTSKTREITGTKYDTMRSYSEIFGGCNYVEHSPFVSSRDRNDQTTSNGLSFNDIYTIWRIYSADCPLPSRRCTYVRSRFSDVAFRPDSALR